MGITTASSDVCTPRRQLHVLSVMLEEALTESNALHHRIREIQLRIAELSASIEAGRVVSVVRAAG
jgi:hypothetical protein